MLKERLVMLRNYKGLSQYDLAKAIGLSRGQISNYELGSRQPDYDTLKIIADFFDISTDYLLGQSDVPMKSKDIVNKLLGNEKLTDEELRRLQPIYEATEIRNIIDRKEKLRPLLGTIRAGLPILADEHVEEYITVPEYLEADYILRVQGNSMVGAGILDGDLAVCKQTQAAFSGQIVVALHDLATGISEATLKYFFDNGKGPVLRAANPSYLEIDMREGYRIVGVMVGLIRMDAPSYQAYREFLAVKDHEEWARTIEMALGKGLTPEDIVYLIDMQARISEKMSSDKLMHNYLLSNPDFNINEYIKAPSGEKPKESPPYPSGRRLRAMKKLDE